jgi:Acyltransferase C-terminus
MELSLTTLWNVLRRNFPREIHLRIKRHSMEEVLQDSNWLFKKWAEKDRLLSHFARHQQFPMDSRYGRIRVFETRHHSLETSVVNLCRLMVLPCLVPSLLFLSIPLFWMLLSIWLAHSAYRAVFLDYGKTETRNAAGQRTPPGGGTSSAPDTPFCPTTPFVSPSPFAWRDMFNNNENNR